MDENTSQLLNASSSATVKQSRLSFPLNTSTKNDNQKFVSRRHTLVPNRSILKPNLDGNATISLISDSILRERRRVSFAPEVTLHKIDYSRSNEERKQKKRLSSTDQANSKSFKLNTSQHQWKNSYQAVDKVPQLQENEFTSDALQSYTAQTSNQFVIDEDSTTQTMEMSVELTQEILKQQKLLKEQSEFEEKIINVEPKSSLKSVFDEVEEEINSSNSENNDVNKEEVDMELTETFIKGKQPKDNNFNDDTNNISEVSMDITQAHSAILPELNLQLPIVDNLSIIDNDNDTMEFTEPIQKINFTEKEVVDTADHTETLEMELTGPLISHNRSGIQNDEAETMELTQQFNNVRHDEVDEKEAEEKEMNDTSEKDDSLIDHPIIETHNEPNESNEPNETNEPVAVSFSTSLPQPPPLPQSQPQPQQEPIANTHAEPTTVTNDSDKDLPMDISMNITSDMETSLIGTEIIPLAEVTGDYTENIEDYDSDDSLVDDAHINVSLDNFFNDVNVHFYDNIGPSENEINHTLIFNSDIKSSPASGTSPTSSSSISSTSTPSNLSNKRANLGDYIDVCTDIPYYHYIIHLINQYQSSIQSISTMVNTFSNDVLESNPTAIREYYQQTSDIKTDLCTNYQAIATFTRKQSKCQNMRFVCGLLNQLILSYDRANQLLEEELNKALEWRRNVLIERQKMIEQKVELNQYIQKLDTVRDNWNSINVDQIKKVNESLKYQKKKKEDIKLKISNASKKVSRNSKSVEDKMMKKTQLIKQIEDLKKNISESTIPSDLDLKLIRLRLSELEKEKCVKFIKSDDLTLLITDTLTVVFKKIVDDKYMIELSVKDIEKFSPFTELVEEFIHRHQSNEEPIQPLKYVRKLVNSWKEFTNIWKELLMIKFLYKGDINSFQFMFKFDFSLDSKNRNTFLIKGMFDHLFEKDHEISVQFTKYNFANELEENIDYSEALDHLKLAFDNKNSIVNRFVLI
ncbi:hypothetical protein C6P40_000033 [Pichia californica]|uniref:Spc7 kinetochore protein domain-containing protein n=1 Tax=Pichia californica TaxID=460514 RepID=A0A9P6WQI2_9ASCO|nr:hypothetical protein C6P40_000033 [[Candida] californica]